MNNLKNLKERIIKDFDNQEDDLVFPEVKEEDVLETVVAAITFSPRVLYEFFDEKAMFININKAEKGFVYSIGEHQSTPFETRLLAETDAFHKALQMNEDLKN